MKLRLPHKFQAALLAAIASVSFTTLSTGTLGAAFFVSGHAFAEDAEEDPSATIDIGDTNLDAQAAMEEEEGTAEKEPGSAPINVAGFNGGPGNNAGLLITESVDIDETALDTVVSSEPVAATSGSADSTPSDNLGFTANPYATGSDTSNGSDDFSLTGTAPAAAYVPGQSGVSAEEGDSAAGTGSGSSTNKTATGDIGSIGGTGSGATGGRVARPMALTAPNMLSPVSSLSVGGSSLGGDSGSLLEPAVLGAARTNVTTHTTQAGDVTYNGYVFTMLISPANAFSTRDFKQTQYVEGAWVDIDDPVYHSSNTAIPTPLGNGVFWHMYCSSTNTTSLPYGNTLHLTGATSVVKLETNFSDFSIGGLIADDNSSTANPTYWFYKANNMTLNGTGAVNMDVNSHVRFSYANTVDMMKGGTWNIHSGKSLTFDNNAGATPTTFSFFADQVLTVQGGGTLYIGRNDNGRYNLTLNTGSVLNITGNSTVQASANGNASSALTNNGTINVEAGSKFVVSMNGSGSGDINAAGTVQMINGSTNERTLSKLTLSGGTLENTSGNETMKRNITELAVNGSSRLEQSSWNTFWKISHLNKGTDTGARTLTWNMDTNHWSNSILYLLDEGSFDGELVASRAAGQAGNGNYQAYVEIDHANALKDGIINLNSANASSVMSLALNAATVNLAGLKGTADSIVYAGAANATQGSSSSKQGEVAPVSTGTSTLNLNVAQGGNYTYAGKVLSGVGIQKSGAGTQTFSGDMSGFNGDIAVSAGTLALTSAVGNASTVSVTGGTLDLGAALTTTGNVTVGSGGTLKLSSGGSLASGGALTLSGATLDLSNRSFKSGTTYTLATASGTIAYDNLTLTNYSMPSGSTAYTLSGDNNALTLTFNGEPPASNTLHIYLLTGQSNSLGCVKKDPASSAMLAEYAPQTTQMWDGNMTGSVVDQSADTKNKAWSDEGKHWFVVQRQQAPTGKGNPGPTGTPYADMTGMADLVEGWGAPTVMGPEYGFSYMMEKQGWNIADGKSDIAIVKVSRDGGDNTQWDPNVGGLTSQILDSVIKAIQNADTEGYTDVSLDGLMFLQGETGDANKGANVKNVLDRLVSYLNTNLTAEMQPGGRLEGVSDKLTVSIGDTVILGEPAGTGACSNASSTVYKQWAESDPTHAGLVYAHDMTIISAGDKLNLHYDGNSQITIGARYAYAMAQVQGLDTTQDGTVRVRSQAYGDSMLGESTVSLNDAKAWWQSSGDKTAFVSTSSLANTVAVWDVSSANMAKFSGEQITADLALGGIRIEDPYSDDENPGDHKATISINNASGTHTLSVGADGIELQKGNLTVNTNMEATANQTWNTAAAGQQNTLNLTGTTTIADGATVTIEGASIVNISTLAGTGGLTVNGAGAVVTLTDKTDFTGATTVTSGSLTIDGTDDLDITGDLTINGGSATFAGNITADTVTLANITSGQGSFPAYSGIITGKDSITLDNYTVESMAAKLVTKRLVAMGGTHTTIHNLTLTACEVTVDNGSDLTLAGHLTLGDTATYTGTLNLANGLSIDVSALNFGDMTQDVTLLSTTSGSLGSTNVNNISLDFGESPEPTSYSLVNQNNNLVLTFDAPASDVLIWNNTDGNWSNATDADLNWHTADAPATPVAFTTGKNVRFDSNAEGHTVTLTENITAGTMTIDNGVSVTMSGGSNTLEVASIDGAGATLALNGGTVSVAQNSTVGSLSGSAALQIAKNATLTVGGTADSTYSGVISGEGGLTKTGNGTLTLNGSNTLSGHITVSGGTLKLGNKDALGSASSVSVATGGTLDIYGAKDEATVLDLTLAGGKLVNSGGEASYGSKNLFKSIELTADSEVNASNKEFGLVNGGYASTQLTLGTNTLTKTGTGTFNLVNTTVTGAGFLKAQEGSLYFNRAQGDSSKWGSFESNLEMAGGAVKGDIKYGAAGTIKTTADSTLEAKLHTNSSTLTFDGPRNLTVSGVISDAGSIIKTGNGTLTLTGTNTYNTNTTINAGVVETASETALGTSKVTIAAGATLKVSENLTIQGGSAPAVENSGTIEIADGKKLRLYATAQDRAYNLGNVVVEGDATIEDFNHNINASIASINGTVDSNITLFSNHSSTAATWTIGSSPSAQQTPYQGTLTLKAACDQKTGSSRVVNFLLNDGNMLDGATLQLENGTTGGTLTNNIKLGAETVKLGGISDAADGTVSATRKWNIGSSEGTHTLQLTGADDYSSAVVINSNVNLLKTGSGKQTLTGDNANMNGTVTVNNGTLVAGSANALGTGAITVNDGGTLVAETALDQVGSLTVNNGGILELSEYAGNALYVTNLALKGGSILDVSRLNLSTSSSAPITLLQGGTIDTAGLGGVLVDFGMVIGKSYTLSVGDSNNLVLTFSETGNLIWDGGTDKWDAGTTQHWHKSGEQPGTSMFAQNDNVTFETGDSTANLAGSISAGSMTLQSGANVTVNTKGYDLSVTSISSTGTLTKAGNGSMEVDNAVTLRGTGDSGLKASVTGGELHIKTTGTTVDEAKLVADNGTGEQGTVAFTKLFKGDAISVIGNGKLVLEGNINAVEQNDGAVTLESGIADLEVTGDVTVNRWGAGTYQLNDHSMEVGGNFWLKNHQNLNLAGGNLAVGGSLTLAHENNTASGGPDYHAEVTATDGSTVKLGDIKFYSGGNSVGLTDSTVTFTKDSGNVLSRIGNSASAAANTVTLTNDTLVAQANSWTMNAMSGDDNTTVTVSGSTQLDIGSGKTVTIGGASVGGTLDFGESEGGLVLNEATITTNGLNVMGGNVTFGGSTTLGADASRTIYTKADVDANDWVETKQDVWVVAHTVDDGTSFNYSGATFNHGGTNLTASLEDGDLVAKGEETPVQYVYYIGVNNTTYGNLAADVKTDAVAYDVGESKLFEVAASDLTNKTLVLEQGATWKIASGKNFNNQQLQTLTLNGDATVTAANNGGLIGSEFAPTTMNMNGHTLSVNGGGHFALFNTTATDAGKIVINGGLLQIGHSQRTSSADLQDVVLDFSNNGKLSVDNNSSIKVEGLSGSGTIQREGGSGGTITIENNHGTDCTFSGSISSTPNLVMDAASTGTQTINLTSSATLGTVTVNGGTLALSSTGNLTTGTVSVADGATLDFGNATQTTTTGALTLAGGSTLKLSGENENLLRVSSITANTGSILDLSSLTIDPSVMSYTLLTSTAAIDSSVPNNITVTGLSTGRNYTLAVDGNALVLTFEDLAKTKIWDNNTGNGIWSNETSDTNWHTPNNVYTHVGFDNGDRVQFTGKNAVNVTLGDDVAPADMSIDSDKTVTINTAGNDLTVARGIDGAGASLVVKAQEGDAISTGMSNVTLKNLTLDNGTTTLGGRTEVANKMTVTDGAVVTANAAVVADSLDISGESTVNLEAGGTAATTKVTDSILTVGAASSLGQLTLDGGTVVNNSTLTLSNTQNMVVSGNSRLTGTGTTTTTGILINDDSTLTVDGGQTVSITTPNGVIGGSGKGSTLTLGNATLTGTSSWTLADTVDTVNLTSTTGSGTTFNTNGHVITVDADLSGAGILTKTGTGTLTLAGDNSTFTGNTVVSAGVVKVNDANGLARSANVSVENGATLWFNSDTTASLSGTTCIADGATLHLGSEKALTTTGSLTLSADSTLNLYGMPITSAKTEYVLATGSSIALADGFDMNNVIVEYGTHPAVGTLPKIEVKNIEGGQQALVLTYELNEANTLYWNGGSNVAWTAENVWHDKDTSGNTTFARYDDVFFDTLEYTDTSTRDVQVNVVQNTDVHTMHIAAAEGGLHTVTAVVNSGQTLNVDFLEADGTTEFIKNGAGVANIGIDDKTFGADIELLNGTLNANIISMNGDDMKIGSNVTRTNGNLNLVVGRDDKATNAEFTGNVSGLASMTVREGSNATLSGTVTVPNGVNTVFTVGNDASLTFDHDVNLNALSWVMQGDGDINMQGTTTISQAKTGYFNSVLGNVSVYFKELVTDSGQVSMRMDQSASVKIGTLTLSNDGQETIYFCTQYTGDTKVDRATVEIDKVVVSGDRGLGSNISKEGGMEDYQQGSTIVIRNVDNADGTREGGDILRLCNYVAYYSMKQHGMAPGWEVATVFRVGDSTASREAAFDGVFRLQDSNGTGNWYGTEDKHKQTVMVVEDEFVASNSVIEIKNYCDYSDFGVGIGTNYAQVVGIRDYEGANQKFGVNGNKALLFSGEMSDATDAKIGSDDTLRTLELIGKTGDTDSTVYSTSAGVDKNLHIVKEGAGVQEFKGDSSNFNGSIDAKDGLLRFLNTATLTVQDLTLAENGSATDGTLAVRSDAAGSNVGTAEVHGTLKANSGSKLASNLTLAADSVLDVRSTLEKHKGQYADKTDYVGGLDMLGNSLTLQSGAYLSDADRSALLSMQWGERYELAYNLSSLTLGDSPSTTEAIVFHPENYKENNIEASQFFQNLQEEDYYICYSGATGKGPGDNVGTLYIFKAPEPTTSTLSLLALAALAARRRRKG